MTSTETDRVVCPVCPRHCQLAPGETGACHARRNEHGRIVATSRGKVCALALDPIEKKPLFHFYPGTAIVSLGMAGCNLHCLNCQNASISQCAPDALPSRALTPDSLVTLLHETGVSLVAYTYTEPLVAPEYVLDCARAVRAAGGRNVLVTAAWVEPTTLAPLLPFIDAANVDIKSMRDAFYRTNCKASLAPVLDALRQMHAAGLHLEITNLLIPGRNDSPEERNDLICFVRDELGAETPLHFSRFFPRHRLTTLPPTPETTLTAAKEQALAGGLRHVYLGNTAHGELTRCAACDAPLILREGFTVVFNRLVQGGRCPDCNALLYGRFV